MQLSAILDALSYESAQRVDGTILCSHVSCNSRRITPGGIFVAILGAEHDGHTFIPDAIEKGAVAVIIEDANAQSQVSDSIPCITVKNSRQAYAQLASCFFSDPSQHIKVIGVTGTNGKTTVAFLIQHILNTTSSCGMLSTITYDTGGRIIEAGQTTPDPYDINQYLSEMREHKYTYCVMEVSSHALVQYRVDYIHFDAAIFTNLTQDHLDYHHTMDDYFLAKARLFKELLPQKTSFINSDSDYGRQLCAELSNTAVTYGIHTDAHVTADDIQSTLKGLSFIIRVEGKTFSIKSSLLCFHNVYNILAAFAYAFHEKIDPNSIIQAINDFKGVAGRLESVSCGQPFHVFIDYAHTPDAFQNIFSSFKELNTGKIIAVFGCGGNRDRTKRPLMGRIVSQNADVGIITNDNPRFEDAGAIRTDIINGFSKRTGFQYEIIPERALAIEKALRMAQRDDIVLILGKGHEEYMIQGGEKYSFSDRDVATKILKKEFSNDSVK